MKRSLCLGSGGLTVIRLWGEIRGKSEVRVWRVLVQEFVRNTIGYSIFAHFFVELVLVLFFFFLMQYSLLFGN